MNRRELGIAALGAAAGVAGCTGGRNLIVPEALAAKAIEPQNSTVHTISIHGLKEQSSFGITLEPRQTDYWKATNSDIVQVAVDHAMLSSTSVLSVKGKRPSTTGYEADITVTGKNSEILFVHVLVVA